LQRPPALRSLLGVFIVESPLVLRLDPSRIPQQRADISPHGLLQQVRSYVLVLADPLAPEAVGVRAGAAVVGVRTLLPLRGPLAPVLAVVGVAAILADQQSLEQVAGPPPPLPLPAPVLLQLLGDGGEQRFADQGRDRDRGGALRRVVDGVRAPRLLRPPALRPQPLAAFTDLRLPEAGRTPVGRVPQDVPDGRAGPGRVALG